MGNKPNWGAGLRSLGRSLGDYASMQYQREMQQAELDRRAAETAATSAEWYKRQQFLSGLKREEAAYDQAAATAQQDIDNPQMYLPSKEVQAPVFGGNVNPLSGYINSTPELQSLAVQQGMNQPVRRDQLLAALADAGKRIASEKKAQQSSDITLARQKEMADYNANLKPETKMVDLTLPDGKVVKVAEEDYAMRYHQWYGPGTVDKGPPLMTENEAYSMVDNMLPKDRNTKKWGEDITIPQAGKYVGKEDRAILGDSGYAQLRGALANLAFTGEYGVGKKTQDDLFVAALNEIDLPNEGAALPEEYQWMSKATIDDKGDADPTNDVLMTPGRMGFGSHEMLVSEARDKIMGKAKKGTIRYKAAMEILQGIGLDKYNEAVPTVGATQAPVEQNQSVFDPYK